VTPELLASLDVPLPDGRLITSDEGSGTVQPLWLSDAPVSADLWVRLLAEHPTSGLWPLLLDSHLVDDGEFRPWSSGELFPERMSSPDAYDPAALLARWWQEHTGADDVLTAEERIALPFGRAWPAPALDREGGTDADEKAAEYARVFTARHPQARLGLVAAACGADALAAAGWDGPVNYANDTAKFAAVVRDWERRFGARVVALGFSTLHLSIAAPPTTPSEALLVAAEHFAFCPDTLWQGPASSTLTTYATHLTTTPTWTFWWD
jgi:hypothetical protein